MASSADQCKGDCKSEEGNSCSEKASLIPCCSIPLPLPDDVLREISLDARDFAVLHGNYDLPIT